MNEMFESARRIQRMKDANAMFESARRIQNIEGTKGMNNAFESAKHI